MIKPGMLLNKRYKVLRKVAEGGFSQIFEVQDTRQRNMKNGFGILRGRSVKILKVLDYVGHQQHEAEDLFQREIFLLKRLKHPGIVQYVDDFDYINDQEVIPCLVLEKASGLNLEQWLNQNSAIPEELAIDWLLQFAEILDYLHNNQRIMHLDIKPSNVIVTPKGQLVLIDFGIARQISSTLIAKIAEAGEPAQYRIGTDWFAAPEQLQGKPTLHSDFYAVGKLFIYAFSHKAANLVGEDDEGNVIWNEEVFSLSAKLSSLIKGMIQYSITARIANSAEIIAACLSTDVGKNFYNKVRLSNFYRKIILIIFSNMIATLCVICIRDAGFLKILEMATYDHLLQARAYIVPEKPDPRILIVTIDAQDIEEQKKRGHKISDREIIADKPLLDLLDSIYAHNPSVVGLDIYRDNSVSNEMVKLKSYFKKSDNLIGICKAGLKQDKSSVQGFEPPPEIPRYRLGFSNIATDEFDEVNRRHLLYMPEQDYCPSSYSFGFAVAFKYLQQRGMSASLNQNNIVLTNKDEKVVFSNQFPVGLFYNPGMYQFRNNCSPNEQKQEDCIAIGEIMINYRALKDPNDVALKISLTDLLYGEKIEPNYFSGRIVLVGADDISLGDIHTVPYAKDNTLSISGVVLHAHLISQVLSMAQDKRPALRYARYSVEILWLLAWNLIMFSIVAILHLRYKLYFLLFAAFCIYSIHFFSFAFLGIVFPLAPLGLSSLIAGCIFIFFDKNIWPKITYPRL